MKKVEILPKLFEIWTTVQTDDDRSVCLLVFAVPKLGRTNVLIPNFLTIRAVCRPASKQNTEEESRGGERERNANRASSRSRAELERGGGHM